MKTDLTQSHSSGLDTVTVALLTNIRNSGAALLILGLLGFVFYNARAALSQHAGIEGSRRDALLIPDVLAETVSENISPTRTIAEWSMFELRLTAKGSYSNPYTDIAVTATFSGPRDS